MELQDKAKGIARKQLKLYLVGPHYMLALVGFHGLETWSTSSVVLPAPFEMVISLGMQLG